MVVKEAYRLFIEEHANLVAISCYEYDTVFVFNAVPARYVGTNEANEMFDSLYSVDKKTGKCQGFNPMLMSASEYNRGEQVFNFK